MLTRRRLFAATFVGGLTPVTVLAQQPARVWRIGYLLEARYADDQLDRLRGLAKSLAAKPVDAIIYNVVRPHRALGDVPPEELEQLTLNRVTAPILPS